MRRIRRVKRVKRTKRAKSKSRRRGNVYLGKRVKDTGAPGLDNLSEVRGICKAILADYRSGRISKRTANGRFSLLYNFVIPRDSKLTGKKRDAKKIVKQYWNKLKEM